MLIHILNDDHKIELSSNEELKVSQINKEGQKLTIISRKTIPTSQLEQMNHPEKFIELIEQYFTEAERYCAVLTKGNSSQFYSDFITSSLLFYLNDSQSVKISNHVNDLIPVQEFYGNINFNSRI